ncbi:hypothetical protein DRO69_02155 [Candidatus Bathyarchaeota archaeon]|nr:MAG: hypothetical protein DRO69_02155 [Candidatus Bathyarchaeota archaeon]
MVLISLFPRKDEGKHAYSVLELLDKAVYAAIESFENVNIDGAMKLAIIDAYENAFTLPDSKLIMLEHQIEKVLVKWR